MGISAPSAAFIDPEPLGHGKKRPRPVTPEPAAKHIKVGAVHEWTMHEGPLMIPLGDRNRLVQYTNWGIERLIRGIQRWWRMLRLRWWRRPEPLGGAYIWPRGFGVPNLSPGGLTV